MVRQNPLSPVAMEEEDRSSLKRLVALLRPHWRKLLLTVGMLVGLALVNMVVPGLIKLLFDDVFPHGNWSLLWLILGAVLLVYVVRNACFFVSKYLAVLVGEQVCFELRNSLFERLQQMNLQYYRRHQPGKLSSRLMNDSYVIQAFIQDDLPTMGLASFQFLVLVAVIYAVNWQLALVSTLVLPLHLMAAYKFRGRIKEASRAASEQIAMVHGNLIEKFLGVEVVKGFAAEERENRRFVEAIDASRRSETRSKTYHVGQKIVGDILVGLGTVALLGFGAYQVMGPNAMARGTFLAFFSYVCMLYPTVSELMTGFAKFTRSAASVDRVFEVLESQGEESHSPQPQPTRAIEGHLRFVNVGFRYDNGGPRVIHNLNLEIPAGKVCALVGPSGAGKTTTVSLVPRLIEPCEGHIELDGVDLRRMSLAHLRQHIGIAFQECFLFNSSVLENLRYARPEATLAQITDIARRTGAHDFISQLPHGYHTILGDGGLNLSRGQKQRITLTRAMLRNPRILILDEATASIDVASESQIIPSILEFMRGKTTLMITHRPELIQHADLVTHIVQGRVVYCGPPDGFSLSQLWTPASSADETEQTSAGASDGSSMAGPAEAGEASMARPGGSNASAAGMLALAMMMGLAGLLGLTGCTTPPADVAADHAAPATTSPAATSPATTTPASAVGPQAVAATPSPAASDPTTPSTAPEAVVAVDAAAASQPALQPASPADASPVLAGPATSPSAAPLASPTASSGPPASAASAGPADVPAKANPVADPGAIDTTKVQGDMQPPLATLAIPLSGVTEDQLKDLTRVVADHLRAEMHYFLAGRRQSRLMPEPPAHVENVVTYAREQYPNTNLLQIGYVPADSSKPAQLWFAGQKIDGQQQVSAGEDLPMIRIMARQALANILPTSAEADPTPLPEQEVKAAASNLPATRHGRFIALRGLSDIEARDLLQIAFARVQAELGYMPASLLPEAVERIVLPRDIRDIAAVVKPGDDGARIIQMGYKTFQSQPPHLWLVGQTLRVVGDAKINEDLDAIEKIIDEARQNLLDQAKALRVEDLVAKPLTLSHVEPDRCLAILKALGYQTIDFRKTADSNLGGQRIIEPTSKVDPKQLPIIINMPGSDGTGLVAGLERTAGAFGLTLTPSVATELKHATNTSQVMQLMVLYNPAWPSQYGELLDRVRTSIDVPARQILIEAMVLEISKTGLEKLGVEWALEGPTGNIDALTFGRLPNFVVRNDEVPTLNMQLSNIFGEFSTRVQMLIRQGEAEILSRPSVLTIDNRQASIRVGEDIPVATSITGMTNNDALSFNFKYIPIGILLNVKPRISADGQEIAMQIDGIVSDQVSGEDLVIYGRDNSQELARAPRISTRRVQTYSRIANNTPFIIGGLVSKNTSKTIDKVPLLGDLPLVGHAFRSTRTSDLKREVIIVITPYVLPEKQVVGRNLPEDKDAFDSFGNELFRDAYRIRSEDVFDLTFLRDNPQLVRIRGVVDEMLRRNADLASVYPFNQFTHERFPGEEILVYRQMYEVIKRRAIDQQIDEKRVIFFNPDSSNPSGFHVAFLWRYLLGRLEVGESRKASATVQGVVDALEGKGKVLALTFTLKPEGGFSQVMQQPVPSIQILDCVDRKAWSHLLWNLNQPDAQGNERHTVLIQNMADITRLKRALVLKRAVELNATDQAVTLSNFTVGRLLLMPSVHSEKVYLLDHDTAKYFYLTELYYPAMQVEIEKAGQILRQRVRELGMEDMFRRYRR